ncbi:protein of unknown function [Candidatus Nitrosocosmicus franklandus]|uniref:Uncharacterized protein n=1 Tax=Candidatus Nitrosocosmicus franklandianus TaxID=1798806 RepID=A0A484IAI9_9ARCH|nr:protein of unknown function [Candidatus Nitrosocosmicus franklandus]
MSIASVSLIKFSRTEGMSNRNIRNLNYLIYYKVKKVTNSITTFYIFA